jgi:hypothetical protein
VADVLPAEYCLHEYGREEEAISLGDFLIYRSQIKKVDILPTYEEAMAALPLGRYRHFKGNEHEVIALAKHSETEETMVIYKALYGDGGIWCRPADMWNETVTRDGKTYRRVKTGRWRPIITNWMTCEVRESSKYLQKMRKQAFTKVARKCAKGDLLYGKDGSGHAG